MRFLQNAVGTLLVIATFALTGCASGKYDKFGFSTVEKNGRLYVFPLNSAEYQTFVNTGDMGKSVTRVGEGPNGMTIIAPDGAVIDRYKGM